MATLYVSPTGNNNAGTSASPVKTIGSAMRLVLALLTALLLTGGAVSAQPTPAEVASVTSQCRPGTTTPVSGIVGISEPRAADSKLIALVGATGVDWVRAEISWKAVQPVKGAPYNWADYDRMISGYRTKGVNVAAILTYPPMDGRWASWAELAQDFYNFASAAVTRYAPAGVHYWEMFNEPNLPGYGWLDASQDAATHLPTYGLLLGAGNLAVRNHDPAGVVILGGIASDQHRGLPIETTMNTLYTLGAKNCFDVFAFHPYGYQAQFPAARARVDAVLAAHGDTGKPVWFNEYGWTDYAAMDMRRNPTADTNPMLKAFSQRNSADALFWFSGADYSSKLGTPTFGLANYYLIRRPSFNTFRYLMTQ